MKSTLPAGPDAYVAIDAAAAAVPASAYALRPGDRVAIDIFREADLSIDQMEIDEAGMVTLPLIGELRAAGLSASQLSRQIEAAYGGRYLRNPQANVVMLEASPRTVSVEGEVQDAGVYELQPGYTLLSALALAGSPTEEAKLDEVLVFRTVGAERFGGRFDLTEVRAGRMPDPLLVPGDVIVVGYSRTRGIYRDFLAIMPSTLGSFVALTNNNN